jgi:hypothetical protein
MSSTKSVYAQSARGAGPATSQHKAAGLSQNMMGSVNNPTRHRVPQTLQRASGVMLHVQCCYLSCTHSGQPSAGHLLASNSESGHGQLATCCFCVLSVQVFCDIDLLVYASVWLPWPFAEVSRQQLAPCVAAHPLCSARHLGRAHSVLNISKCAIDSAVVNHLHTLSASTSP